MFQLSASHFEVGMDIIHFCFFLINVFIELMSNFGRIVHRSVTNNIVQSTITHPVSYLIVIEYECPTSIALIFI